MTEETKSSEESIEEEIVEEIPEDDENNTENVENIEFEDADSKPDLPIDYEKKLGEEAGVLISYNVYNSDLSKNDDIRLSGLILSSGSILATIFFMLYEVSQNPCLLELSEKSCDFVKVDSLRSVTTIAVYSGSLGIVMLIYGLGLLRKALIPYALAIAFGGSLILTIVLLMSAFEWVEESVWLLLLPLLFLGMGLAGLHHRRYLCICINLCF